MHLLSITSIIYWSLLTSRTVAKCSHDIVQRGLAETERLHNRRSAYREWKRFNQGATPDIAKRALSSVSGTTWPSGAVSEWQLTDPEQECSYSIDDPSLDAIIAHYPPIWSVASIVPGDEEATAAYNAIINAPGFPNYIQPRGTVDGDFSGVKYDSSDPDCWWSWAQCTTPKLKGLTPDITTCPEPNTWGLTYDDGPNCTHNAFYTYLQEKQLKATLFYIGSNVANHPYQGLRGLADGHEIGVHTWSHRYATALTNEQFFAELWYTRKLIKAILGVTPKTWRPPYGDMDDRIRFIAASLGLTTVCWEFDTFDWRVQASGNPAGIPTSSVEANYQSIINKQESGSFAQHGTIILTHELNNATMSLAELELPNILSHFQHVMPVASCQNVTHPYVEQSWTYANFAQYQAGNNATTNSSPFAGNGSGVVYTGGSVTQLGARTTTVPAGSATAAVAAVPAAVKTSAASLRSASGRTLSSALAFAMLLCFWLL